MPDITSSSGDTIGKTYAFGFFQSELCDNSLAIFPDGTDFSWGVLSFEVDGCDSDNYVEVKIINADDYSILKTAKYTTNGRKELDLSQYIAIGSTQDIFIRPELTSYI